MFVAWHDMAQMKKYKYYIEKSKGITPKQLRQQNSSNNNKLYQHYQQQQIISRQQQQ